MLEGGGFIVYNVCCAELIARGPREEGRYCPCLSCTQIATAFTRVSRPRGEKAFMGSLQPQASQAREWVQLAARSSASHRPSSNSPPTHA